MSARRVAETKAALPFVARCGRGWQVFAIFLSPLLLWLVLGTHGADGRPAVFHVWEQSGMVKKLGVILLFALIPALPLEVFRAQTVFTQEEIRHLPTFGRWRIFRYQDIVDLEVFSNEFARIEFRDGERLKIWAMRADPRVVEDIIRRKLRQASAIRG